MSLPSFVIQEDIYKIGHPANVAVLSVNGSDKTYVIWDELDVDGQNDLTAMVNANGGTLPFADATIPSTYTLANGWSFVHTYGAIIRDSNYFNAKIAQRIAENGGVIPSVSIAAVSATSGTTLTASQLAGGYVSRSGPTADFTDAVDSAANIIAAIPDAVVGSSMVVRVMNSSAFVMTVGASSDSSATVIGTATLNANSAREFLVQVLNLATPSVSLTSIGSMSL